MADLERRWALVAAHRDALVRVARKRGLSPDEAEDCAQEAMTRAVAFPTLDEERVLPFLVTTTVRLCADHGRQRGRAARLTARLAGWHCVEPAPEDDVCDRAEAAHLAERVARLPDRQRRAVLARAAGLSHAEIGRLVGATAKGVESMLGRARTELRRTAVGIVLLVGLPRRHPRFAAAAVATPLVVGAVLGTRVPSSPASPPPVADTVETARPSLPVGVVASARPSPTPMSSPRPTARPSRTPRASGTPAPGVTPSCQVESPIDDRVPTVCVQPSPESSYVDDCTAHGVDLGVGFRCGSPQPRISPSERTEP